MQTLTGLLQCLFLSGIVPEAKMIFIPETEDAPAIEAKEQRVPPGNGAQFIQIQIPGVQTCAEFMNSHFASSMVYLCIVDAAIHVQ